MAKAPSANGVYRKSELRLAGVRPGDVVLHLRPMDGPMPARRLAELGRWMCKLGAGFGFRVFECEEIEQ
jgi:hypothetical protein